MEAMERAMECQKKTILELFHPIRIHIKGTSIMYPERISAGEFDHETTKWRIRRTIWHRQHQRIGHKQVLLVGNIDGCKEMG